MLFHRAMEKHIFEVDFQRCFYYGREENKKIAVSGRLVACTSLSVGKGADMGFSGKLFRVL